eukprot:scaffold624_cov402-Prasinococcus_capsulatus_cf.AAC.70
MAKAASQALVCWTVAAGDTEKSDFDQSYVLDAPRAPTTMVLVNASLRRPLPDRVCPLSRGCAPRTTAVRIGARRSWRPTIPTRDGVGD